MNDEVRDLAESLLKSGWDGLMPREQRVLRRLAKRIAISRNLNEQFREKLGFGERLADKVAAFGGSWTFIILFAVILAAWVLTNTILLSGREVFDPYPFIFLNLILSMLAAVQAPVIMMSQNRQSAKDRLTASHDYEVNLKAELEIMGLHDKLDDIRARDIQNLLAQQAEQIDAMNRLMEKIEKASRTSTDPPMR